MGSWLPVLAIPVLLALSPPALAPGCHHALWEMTAGTAATPPRYARIVECYARAPGDDHTLVITNDGAPGARVDRGDVLIFGLAVNP